MARLRSHPIRNGLSLYPSDEGLSLGTPSRWGPEVTRDPELLGTPGAPRPFKAC